MKYRIKKYTTNDKHVRYKVEYRVFFMWHEVPSFTNFWGDVMLAKKQYNSNYSFSSAEKFLENHIQMLIDKDNQVRGSQIKNEEVVKVYDIK